MSLLKTSKFQSPPSLHPYSKRQRWSNGDHESNNIISLYSFIYYTSNVAFVSHSEVEKTAKRVRCAISRMILARSPCNGCTLTFISQIQTEIEHRLRAELASL